MLLFSGVSMALLYLIERVQLWLPFNPQKFANVPPALAWGTAASFTTNTNWQAYGGESTMSYFTQMAGLAYHNFAFGGDGHRAGHRGDSRHRAQGDRQARQLLGGHDALPAVGAAAAVPGRFALVLVSQGVIQNLKPYTTARTDRAANRAGDRRGRQDHHANGHAAGDRARAGGLAGSHQDAGHQRRRIFQRQQRASV